ncbi:ser/thr phosphatase family protein (macronuclear) [Tetrahymena thermophila SB210]|uniref:Ser/thr phosphatase family protein n=1 Tax=Tetrahymena thermophila (strain SB210) TaxID=312017 RepID=Q24I78_TETTS|nr:ser/thr phosphatase family protein [Tetrahymena thermophila SB210]EAS07360.2 ser/thr phosphatase family protein [Tetrahymena thermophila SB210]|eukprot:XP_001027602.2 ser/thr phosphatase family protein [Tetrahymena thermophila SB210]
MKLKVVFILFCIVITYASEQELRQCEPQGVKISLGDNRDKTTKLYSFKQKSSSHDYTITYFSKEKCPQNYIKIYQTQETEFKLYPKITYFRQDPDTITTPEDQTRDQVFEVYIYEFQIDVKKLNLEVDSFINYSCFYSTNNGTIFEQKGEYKFYNTDFSKLSNREVKVLWVADFDIDKTQIKKFNGRKFGYDNMKRIEKYIKKNRKQYASIIGGGDYAYDLVDDSGQRGANFLKAGEFLFSQIPFVTIAGNHEGWYNFQYYNAFFRNPNYSKTKNDYYTLDFGNLVMIGINTNRFIRDEQNKIIGLEQPYFTNLVSWLDKTLYWANQNYQWVVVFTHQNYYCFEDNILGSCYKNPQQMAPLENVLLNHKVDIYLSGHIHAYERIHPIKNGQLQFKENSQCSFNKCSVYNLPQAPVYVVDGTGGTKHSFFQDSGYEGHPKFTASSDRHLGFSTITVKNNTHLHFQHILSDTFQVFDEFYIYKPDSSNNSQQIDTPEVSYESEFVTNSSASNMIYFIFIFLIFCLAFLVIYLLYRKRNNPSSTSRQNSYNPNNAYNQQFSMNQQRNSDDSL